MGIFDKKIFNSEVFMKYLETVPRVKQNAFLKAGILRGRNDLKTALTEQTGGNLITVPMTGLIGGDALNYDGMTDITATSLNTYSQQMVVVGRAKAWSEKDFSADISSTNFMDKIGEQVSNYWDDIDEKTILCELKGIFGVTRDGFSEKHTYDITSNSTPTVGATTLNSAIQKASGANKNLFTMAIMHSAVATTLENLNLIDYNKYTDEKGVQKDLSIVTWNGRTVLIDDDVPSERIGTSAGEYSIQITTKASVGDVIQVGDVILEANKDFSLATDTATGNASAIATKLASMTDPSITCYTFSSSGTKVIITEKSGYFGTGMPTVSATKTAGGSLEVATETVTAPTYVTHYTTYVLGSNAFDYVDCGAKVPVETKREALVSGGKDYLITRQRKVFAPRGFSFVMPTPSIMSPTDAILSDSASWNIVTDSTGSEYFNSKAIPFVRIISNG